MRVNERMKKLLSIVLTLCMVLSYIPAPAYAVGTDCTHHTEHTADCGYVAAVEGVPCAHEHDENCGYVAAVPGSDCAHVHDDACGYVQAVKGSGCTFVCTECKAEEKTCTCESTDPGEHAPFCDLYVRTYEECKCVLDCAVEGLNDYCETCYFEGVEACGASGEEEAVPFVQTGYTGECSWTFDENNGLLTISGPGSMGSNAFSDIASSIQSVIIKEGVTTIVTNAFRGCSNLTSVTIPGSVKTIERSAFSGCSSLTTINYYGLTKPTASPAIFGKNPPSTINVPENYEDETFAGKDVEKKLPPVNTSTTYTITATAAPVAGGTVTGAGDYTNGADVTLTATANTGYKFVNWTENGAVVSTDATYTFTASADCDLVANFAELTSYTVTAAASPTEGGTVSGGDTVTEGTEVTLTAAANDGYKFVNWTEDGAVVSTKASYKFTVTENCELVAVFVDKYSGECGEQGDNALWKFDPDTGVLTISGSGNMKHYNQGEAPWYDLRAQIKSVVIENGITIVSQFGFYKCDQLTGVTIPDSVTSFGTGAFSDCDALTSFTIPPQVKSMGQGVFTGCSNLTSVTISAGVEIIPANTFASTPLTSITIPASVKSIQLYAFYDCEQLTTVNYLGLEDPVSINEPYNVEEAQQVFRGCNISGITVNVPAGYQSEYFCGLPVNKTGYSITVNASPAEGGTVTGGGSYEKNASVTVTATAESGYRFTGWTENGEIVSTAASYTFTATANRDLIAVFAPHEHNWTYTAEGKSITATCGNADGACPDIDGGSVTISASDATYEGTAQETATVAYSEDWNSGELTVSYANNTNAGTATASITIGEATASVEFTIAKAEIDGSTLINPEFAEGLIYNGTAQALVTKTGSVDGGYIVYSLSIDGEYTTTIPVATEAGNYGVYWTIECDENHYVVGTPGNSRVTIAKANPEYTVPTGLTATYGDTLANVELPTGWAWKDAETTFVGNAGTRTFKALYNPDSNNYNTVEADVTVEVAKADPEYTVPTGLTATYGNTLADVELPTGWAWKDAETTSVGNAGTNTFQAIFTPADTMNYTVVESGVTITVAKATASVETAPADNTLIYTGEAQALVTAGAANNGEMQYSTDNQTWSTTIPAGTNAGDYTVYYKVVGDANYADTAVQSVAVTIAKAKAEITVDTDPITATYGDSVELPEATTNFGTVTCDKAASDLVNAGTYTVTYSVAGTDNYDGDSKTVTVTIEKLAVAEPTVTGTYTYTGTEQTVALAGIESCMTIASGNKATNTGSYEVVLTLDGNHKWADGSDGKVQWNIAKAKAEITVDPDPITVTYGEAVTLPTATTDFGTVTCDKAASDLVNAGTYTVTYSVAGTDNYDGDSKTVTVTINPKNITEADVALDGSLVYNGEEQTQQITVTDGITYEITGNKATKAGKYELTVKGTGNYAGTITLDWEVAKATVTITADNKVIYIGEDIPVLTYKVSGLIGDDKLIKDPTLTTNADENQAGSYTITAANADAGDNYTITYVSGALTIMDQDTEVMTRIEITELTDVPDGLKDTEFDTVDKIIEELISRILATVTGYSAENMVHYDVTWQFSLDSGETWIRAMEEHFPTEGITVILPYPEGTNARDYDFAVSHMFSVTSQRLGTTAGDVELPKVEETADGIRVTLTGLSPVTVAAKYHDHTGGTATCTDKAICSICGTAYGELDATNHAGGTEVKNAKEATCGAEGYTGDTYCKGCNEVVEKGTTIKATGEHTYGDWKVVKEPTKTTKGEKQRTCSVCGHVDSKEIPVLSDTPATGDNSNIMLYSSMFTVSLAGLVVLLLAAKKRKQETA